MKKSFKIFALFCCLCLFFMAQDIKADPTPENIPVVIKKKDKDDPDPNGNRKPSMPIPCFLSLENGIQCDFISEEILTYEIWDVDDSFCMASYVDEQDFIYHIFYIPGDYLIKLVTQNYIYFGYISTL